MACLLFTVHRAHSAPCPANTYTATEGSSTTDECLPCPRGKYATVGAKTCEDCPAGTYSSEDGQECTKCAEGKSTGGLTGLSKCLSCRAGSYQAGQGAAQCEECAVNFYSETNATECIACPAGKTTNDLKGSAVCLDPSEASGASELDCTMGSAFSIFSYLPP